MLLLLGMILSVSLTACAGMQKEDKTADLPITAEWSFYKLSLNGTAYTRKIQDDHNEFPRFHTDDGMTFTLYLSKQEYRDGKIVWQEDGSWLLYYDENKDPLTAKIKGDELTITSTKNLKICFLGDNE